MITQDDWRLNGLETYMQGVPLVYQPWKPADPRNDHDHCVFCWAKFAKYAGCLHEGYATEDREYWLCNECFHDFKERFKWKVK